MGSDPDHVEKKPITPHKRITLQVIEGCKNDDTASRKELAIACRQITTGITRKNGIGAPDDRRSIGVSVLNDVLLAIKNNSLGPAPDPAAVTMEIVRVADMRAKRHIRDPDNRMDNYATARSNSGDELVERIQQLADRSPSPYEILEKRSTLPREEIEAIKTVFDLALSRMETTHPEWYWTCRRWLHRPPGSRTPTGVSANATDRALKCFRDTLVELLEESDSAETDDAAGCDEADDADETDEATTYYQTILSWIQSTRKPGCRDFRKFLDWVAALELGTS